MTSPVIDHGDVTIRAGDAVAELAHFEAGSAQCVVTSPPFWGLRDYGTGRWEGGDPACSHVAGKARGDTDRETPGGAGGSFRGGDVLYRSTCGLCGGKRIDDQIGLEPTPEAWAENVVRVLRACRRVLRPDGVAWVEVGDSYNAYNGNRGPSLSLSAKANHPAHARGLQAPGMKSKDLVGAPWLLAFALRADGWWLRSDTIWERPNPMPESCTDRPTKAHSYVFLLSASPRYYYDAAAISTPARPDSVARADRASKYDDPALRALVPYASPRPTMAKNRMKRHVHSDRGDGIDGGGGQAAGELTWGDRANARSVWSIATEATTFEHFAVMPTALAARCILAGSRPGDTVLDPFMGSGTTAIVARELGRRAIGVELSADYLAIAAQRLAQGSLLT